MQWLYLAIAVVFEVAVGIAAGNAQGFRNVPWTIATLISGAIATFFLSQALLNFDVGVGYAVWAGIGAVGSAVLGPVFFTETLAAPQVFWLAVVIAGVVWLKLADRPKATA